MTNTLLTDIDPSDTFDTQRFDEWPVVNTDWTADVPPIPGTTAVHPIDCRCLPCQAEAEYLAYVDQMETMCECEIDWTCGACREGRSTIGGRS